MGRHKEVQLARDWFEQLEQEFDLPYMVSLRAFLLAEKAEAKVIHPGGSEYFNALNSTPFKSVKVVILGQDPYHGPNQAHGLCFSVNEGVSHPPSLKNIFKELKEDLGIAIPKSGNLEHLAKQGVLLLNAILTVKAHEAGSHQKKGWEQFTDAVIETISESREGVVFLLWGRFAI